MEAIAKTKNLKGSPRKARLVIDLIRGRNVSQALAILKFTDKRAAEPIAKTLQSAIANATYLAEKQNIAIDPDDLFIKTCFVDMGVHKNRRRMRPAPQGRAYRETRHYCHITILVSSDKPEVVEYVKKPVAKKAEVTEKKAKAPAKKSDEVKETKKAKVEEKIEEVETPVITETPAAVIAEDVKSEAEIADAKDATSQTTAEKNETKPADEAQIDTNEELEKQ
jgi:large subunit ribosomal protein L22